MSNKILSNQDVADLDLSALKKEVFEAVQVVQERQKELLAFPFGFVRIPFPPKGGEGYYLHVWPNELAAEHEPHSHRFNMVSTVLSGTLKNITWTRQHAEEGEATHYAYSLNTALMAAGHSRLGGAFKLAVTNEEIIKCGQTYEMPHGEYHTSEVLEGPVLTLIRSSDIDLDSQPVNYVPIEQATQVEAGETFFLKKDMNPWDSVNKILEVHLT